MERGVAARNHPLPRRPAAIDGGRSRCIALGGVVVVAVVVVVIIFIVVAIGYGGLIFGSRVFVKHTVPSQHWC